MRGCGCLSSEADRVLPATGGFVFLRERNRPLPGYRIPRNIEGAVVADCNRGETRRVRFRHLKRNLDQRAVWARDSRHVTLPGRLTSNVGDAVVSFPSGSHLTIDRNTAFLAQAATNA